MGGIVMRAAYGIAMTLLLWLVALPTAIFTAGCLIYIIVGIYGELRKK